MEGINSDLKNSTSRKENETQKKQNAVFPATKAPGPPLRTRAARKLQPGPLRGVYTPTYLQVCTSDTFSQRRKSGLRSEKEADPQSVCENADGTQFLL